MGETTVAVDAVGGVVAPTDAGRPFWEGIVWPALALSGPAAALPKKKLLNEVAIEDAREGIGGNSKRPFCPANPQGKNR